MYRKLERGSHRKFFPMEISPYLAGLGFSQDPSRIVYKQYMNNLLFVYVSL